MAEYLERDGKQFLLQKVMQAISSKAKPQPPQPDSKTSLAQSSNSSEQPPTKIKTEAQATPNPSQFSPKKAALLKELYTPIKRGKYMDFEVDESKQFKELSTAMVVESTSKERHLSLSDDSSEVLTQG